MSGIAHEHRVCAVTDLAVGAPRAWEIDGVPVVVVRCADDTVHAIRNECSHAQVTLSDGEVDDCTIECWLHGSRFDLRTGAPTSLPATQSVPVYAVDVRDGDVYLSLTPTNGAQP